MNAAVPRPCRWLSALPLLLWCLPALLALPPLPAGELHDAVAAHDLPRLEQHLREHPEFVDARDSQGRTALHLAAESGALEAIRLLVAHGADVDATDALGRTPAMLAEQNQQPAAAAELKNQGAGAVDFSRINDTVISGTTWCIFGSVAAFGGLLFLFIVTRKKKSPDELLAEELNDQ